MKTVFSLIFNKNSFVSFIFSIDSIHELSVIETRNTLIKLNVSIKGKKKGATAVIDTIFFYREKTIAILLRESNM